MVFECFKVHSFFSVYFIVSQELPSKQYEAKDKNQICLSLNKQFFWMSSL